MKMFNKISFILLACFLGSISCLIRDKGYCSPSTVLNSTELLKFSGKWYEVARVESEQEEALQCVTFDFDSKPSYETGYPVTQTGLDAENLEYIYIGNLIMYTGNQFREDEAIFEFGQFMDEPYSFGFKVIDTDFENYAVILGCVEVPDFSSFRPFGFDFTNLSLIRTRIAWIFSRTPEMDVTLKTNLVAKLADNGIDESYLVYNKLTSCPSNY